MNGSKGAGLATPASTCTLLAGAAAQGRVASAERNRGGTPRRAVRSHIAFRSGAFAARELATKSTLTDVTSLPGSDATYARHWLTRNERFARIRKKSCFHLRKMGESL